MPNSHNPQAYKGHIQYVNNLGRFVGAFEDVINKRITSEKKFKEKFPQTYLIYYKEIKKYVGHSTIDTIPSVLQRRMGVTLVYNGSNCLVYELCRHIRNSFCHMLLEVDGNVICVIDKSKGNRFSSKGTLTKKTFLNFVKSLVQEYESSFN